MRPGLAAECVSSATLSSPHSRVDILYWVEPRKDLPLERPPGSACPPAIPRSAAQAQTGSTRAEHIGSEYRTEFLCVPTISVVRHRRNGRPAPQPRDVLAQRL